MRTALVLGGAGCLWDDVEAALDLGEFHGVVTCNDATAFWPGPIDAAVSLHPEKWPLWLARRAQGGRERPLRVFGHHEAASSRRGAPGRDVELVEMCFPGQSDTGSSGLFALKVALTDLGFDRAVLCGVPMLPVTGHFFDAAPWTGAGAHQLGWKQALPAIQDRARSMSGWTQRLLGAPTADWLAA